MRGEWDKGFLAYVFGSIFVSAVVGFVNATAGWVLFGVLFVLLVAFTIAICGN